MKILKSLFFTLLLLLPLTAKSEEIKLDDKTTELNVTLECLILVMMEKDLL